MNTSSYKSIQETDLGELRAQVEEGFPVGSQVIGTAFVRNQHLVGKQTPEVDRVVGYLPPVRSGEPPRLEVLTVHGTRLNLQVKEAALVSTPCLSCEGDVYLDQAHACAGAA